MTQTNTTPRLDELQPSSSATPQTPNSVSVLQRRAQEELIFAKQRLEESSADLAKSLALLQATFESSRDGILSFDLEGRLLGNNNKFLSLWSVPADLQVTIDNTHLVLQHLVRQIKHPAEFLQRVDELATDPEAITGDMVELVDGRIFEWHRRPQKINDQCVGIVVTWRDVTEHQLMERALKESEQRFRTLWETAPETVVLMDEHGIVQYANAALHAAFGYMPDEVTGHNMAMLVPPRLREAHRRGIARYLETGEKRLDWRSTEVMGLHRDGSEIPLEVSFSHVELHGRHLFAGFLRDITERKRAEQARLVLEEHLRDSQKLEAIGTLAGGIAHDFNNILGSILGNAALARSDTQATAATLVSLDEIQKAGLRAKNLVQQILAFSRKQPQEFRDQALRPLVEETIGLLRVTLPAGVTLSVDLQDEPIFIRADTTQIQQVLMNLCTNAWQALKSANGHIAVRVDSIVVDAATARQLNAIAPGQCARLTVVDNGQGMDEATQARVFEPFYTTKEINKGTGLGLAVAHGIVMAHRGAIAVSSVVGQGTTFTVYLPAIAFADEHPAVTKPKAVTAKGNGEHVIYVDDDEAMVFLVKRMLEKLGYRVSGFENPLEALAAIEAQPSDYDLLVSDFNMPGASGLDIARRLSEVHPSLPIVITSGYVSEQLQEGARAIGVRHIINKPDTIDELCAIVQRVLQEHKVSRANI
jgi:PAS domain S-box-containing protein